MLRHSPLLFLLVLLLGSGCGRKITQEQKDLRRDLRIALRDHSYPKAAELAQRLVGTAPQDNSAWESLVRAQIGARDFSTAQQTLGEWRAVVRKPSPKFDELTGDLALKQQNPALAFQSWSKALKAAPKNLRLLRKIAHAHRRLGQPQQEDRLLSAMIETDDNATTRIERALARRKLHRWPEAVEDYRRAQELAPDDPDVRRGVKLFERLGKFLPQVRELDARLALTPEDDQLLADRALLFLRSEDYELGLRDGAAASQKAPWAMRPRLFRGMALVQLGRANECAELAVDQRVRLAALAPEFLQTISRLDSEISVERSNIELYLARAWQLNEIGQPALALEDARTALGIDERSAGAYSESSYALTKLGQADEAFAQIKRATDCDPNFSTAWQYRGELEMAREDLAAAIDSFSRALALNQTAVALQKREQCYMKLGQFEKAEEDHRALELLNAR